MTFSIRNLIKSILALPLLLAIIFIAVQPTVIKAQTVTLKTAVDLREGPGAYYPMVLRLQPGAQVTPQSSEEGWVKISIDDHSGWIPERVFRSRGESGALAGQASESSGDDEGESSENGVSSRMDDMFGEMDGSGSSSSQQEKAYASPAEVAAAVKGFSRKFTTRRGETTIDLTRNFENRINVGEYRSFRRDRIGWWNWEMAQKRFPLRTDTIPSMTPEIEKMGWGIANALAQKGLVRDRELLEYLNYLALIVAESSHRYEIPIQVHVLDTDDITGYAVPNGIIFISRGALNIMRSEAEYAFFIGHELSHVVMQHGVKEVRDRRAKIKADEAFSELESDLKYDERQDEEVVQTSRELTEMADQIYEYVISKKLESYEHEADFWGMVYAYRAGYEPTAAIDLIQRIHQQQGDFKNKIGELDWQGASLKERIKNCRGHLKHLNRLKNINSSYAGAWRDNVKY